MSLGGLRVEITIVITVIIMAVAFVILGLGGAMPHVVRSDEAVGAMWRLEFQKKAKDIQEKQQIFRRSNKGSEEATQIQWMHWMHSIFQMIF
jgi:hypothetical protein